MPSSRTVAGSEGELGELSATETGRAELTVERILAWADAHHAAHGTWPEVGLLSRAGAVAGAPGEWWKAINHALALGLRGLPGDSSLAELLAEFRGAPLPDMRPQALAEKIWIWEQEQFPIKRPRIAARRRPSCPLLDTTEILAWADAHHAATGAWPTYRLGRVRTASFEVTWSAIHKALSVGRRGLPGGSSLHRLLVGYQRVQILPRLTLDQVLAWADAHHAATGRWPTRKAGRVIGTDRESWARLDDALVRGNRGLPGGLSVSRLLQTRHGRPDQRFREPLSIDAILAWADTHHAATGVWPNVDSGPVRGVPDRLTWQAVDGALAKGHRGLPEGSSLFELLAEHREKRAALTVGQILAWADAHQARTGAWPSLYTGKVVDADGEKWKSINSDPKAVRRGLPAGQSLSGVLAEHRGAPNVYPKKPLCIDQILTWADAYYAAKGRWPEDRSGPIDSAPGETWALISNALRSCKRGLAGRTSLARLLREHRGPQATNRPLSLTVEQVLAWADAHHAASGRWPTADTGAVTGGTKPTWRSIDHALHNGLRGLPKGSSIARLLAQHRGHRNKSDLSRLTLDQILGWADAHHAAHGRWPSSESGPVTGASGETWQGIANALRDGRRGLTGSMRLGRLLAAREAPERK